MITEYRVTAFTILDDIIHFSRVLQENAERTNASPESFLKTVCENITIKRGLSGFSNIHGDAR